MSLLCVTLSRRKEDTMTTAAAVETETASTPAVRNAIITWFEILAADYERAVRFYEETLGVTMLRGPEWPGMAIFPYQQPAVSGCVVKHDYAGPADGGVTVYLNCDGKIDDVLGRVPEAGGAILEEKNYVPKVGWVAQIRDTEGNRVGLHAVV
jgi:hypothetical protein